MDAGTGSQGALGRYVRDEIGVTLQGALLASKDSLYAPQGRSVPLVYRLVDGERMGGITGSGGVYCVLTEDEQLISMPANQKEKEDTVRIADGKNRETLVSFAGADRMIVSGPLAYFHQGTKLKVIDRFKILALQVEIDVFADANEVREKEKKKSKDKARIAVLDAEIKVAKTQMATIEARKPTCELWAKELPTPIGFMLAGKTLFVGGDGTVAAYQADTGDELWKHAVDGRAYGLAAANGQLMVSTDSGSIHCFASKP
ncbi:MAG: outer membrane protein assembly factor BamB family protein [Verrucomicrobiales bacterium]